MNSPRSGNFVSSPCSLTVAELQHLVRPGVRLPPSALAKMAGRPIYGLIGLLALSESAPPCEEPAPALSPTPAPLPKPAMPPRVRRVLTEVSARHGLTLDQLRASGHVHKAAHARQEAYHALSLVKNDDGSKAFSWPQISGFLGRADHTTALKGARRHLERVAQP